MRLLLRFLLPVLMMPTATGASVLTEEEFLSVLDDSHPSLVALEREFAEAEAKEKTASALPNPDLRVEREAWGESAQQTTMAVGWTPPLLGGRGPLRDAARFGVESAAHRREGARLEARASARAAYAEWWMAAERWDVLSRQAARVREIVSRVRSRAASGEESGLTARRFDLASLRVQADLVRAEVERARALAAIRSWYRADDAGWEPIRPDLPQPPDSLGWEERPDVLALRAAVRGAEQERKGAGGIITFPSLEFGWIWQDGDVLGVDGPLAGLAWTVPIFDRNQAEKTRAAGGLRAARADLEVAERKARADLTAALEAYAVIRESAVDAWDGTADLGPLIEAALASFQAGEHTDTDLLDILASALEARLSALELYSAALSAHRALEEAAGKPLTAGASR